MNIARPTAAAMRRAARAGGWVLLVLFAIACDEGPAQDHPVACEMNVEVGSVTRALSTIDCRESSGTGYENGRAFPIAVVTVEGKPVEKATANAYYAMAQAAGKAGVTLRVVSGFRTMAEQERLYTCYVECSCNNCNLAAKPGTSNHQSGSALDLNASDPGVLAWLQANAARFGFEATVPSENWHYELTGEPPMNGHCDARFAGASLGAAGQSFPIVARGPVTLKVGETVRGWLRLKNVGTQTWSPGGVWLAPIPRDQASSFAAASWRSATRISTLAKSVAPGEVGEFALDLAGQRSGRSMLRLGFVAEGLTWFADGPSGGGPADGYFAVDIEVQASAAAVGADAGLSEAVDAASAPTAPSRDAAASDRPDTPSAPAGDFAPTRADDAAPDIGPCASER